jgi:MFS family permease
VSGLGIAVGPISGGFLIEHFAWSSIFLINLPVVATCLIGAIVLVPSSRDPESPKLDLPGTGLSIAGLSAVVWALIEAPERGWGSPMILAAFAAGAAIIATFIAWERHTDHPMLDVSVFRNLRFSAASVSITFVFFALMGVMYFLTPTCSRCSATARWRPASRCCRSRSAWFWHPSSPSASRAASARSSPSRSASPTSQARSR